MYVSCSLRKSSEFRLELNHLGVLIKSIDYINIIVYKDFNIFCFVIFLPCESRRFVLWLRFNGLEQEFSKCFPFA